MPEEHRFPGAHPLAVDETDETNAAEEETSEKIGTRPTGILFSELNPRQCRGPRRLLQRKRRTSRPHAKQSIDRHNRRVRRCARFNHRSRNNRRKCVASKLFQTKSPDLLIRESEMPERKMKRSLTALDLTCSASARSSARAFLRWPARRRRGNDSKPSLRSGRRRSSISSSPGSPIPIWSWDGQALGRRL